jgi:ATP-dependent DNA helicase RecG
MTEKELQDYLTCLLENESVSGRNLESLSAVSGRSGDDAISYVSAIANMQGGHLIIGIQDQTHMKL